MMPLSNILDSPQPTLPKIWEDPDAAEPTLRPVIAHFITKHIYSVLERGGYTNPKDWLDLYLTGSLCTYQYSDTSDADVSLFVNATKLPEWSRSEMIGLMISGCDGVLLPGTTYEIQAYVVSPKIHPADIYKAGLRAGYRIDDHHWISPPDRHAIHDVQSQEGGYYAWALEQSDKMERLLRYEPDKAVDFWHQIHRKRMRDQYAGKGDFSLSNILYKFLSKRGLIPDIAKASGEHISKVSYITPNDLSSPTAIERGLSRPVSHQEFDALAAEGQDRYNQLSANVAPTTGLDQNWDAIKQHAYEQTRSPWGGATIDAHTGQPLESDADAYALSVREPGSDTMSIPATAGQTEFHSAMDMAKQRYQHILSREGHHLGVFHDADLGRIDMDPVLVVNHPHDVETIGAHTNAVGGAYHFKSGDGYWPPHVPDANMGA